MSIKELLFFIVIFLTNIIQCVTGFAGTVLAMPFSLMLVGFSVAKPVLNVLGMVASIGVVATNYKFVNKKELLKIVAIMLIGMIFSFVLGDKLAINEAVLYKILGIVVILFMLLGCYTGFVKKEQQTQQGKNKGIINIVFYAILLIAGVVHGMFVCGGPLLIIYVNKKLKDRNEFRATLSSVWIILNGIMMFNDIRGGYFNKDLLIIIAISIVILFFALLIGNRIAKKLNYKAFMILTYILMGISGLSLLVK